MYIYIYIYIVEKNCVCLCLKKNEKARHEKKNGVEFRSGVVVLYIYGGWGGPRACTACSLTMFMSSLTVYMSSGGVAYTKVYEVEV